MRSLLATLKQHANLVKALNDPNTYLTNETPDPLRRSLHSLDLDGLISGALGVEECVFDHNLLSGTILKLKQLAMDTTSHLFQSDEKKQESPSAQDPDATNEHSNGFPMDIAPAQDSSTGQGSACLSRDEGCLGV